MPKASTSHMCEPSTDQAVVGWRYREELSSNDGPEVRENSRADSDNYCADKLVHARLLLALHRLGEQSATSSQLEVNRVSELNIDEVARRSGVPASALRYYEEKGLITSIGRNGLRRVFNETVLERLALIALGRESGFALDEIARMFAPNGRPKIDRQLLSDKATALDKSIQKLTAMRDGLRHAAACSAPSHMECPKFRRLLGLASATTNRRVKKATLKKR
jgi:DNA-binding transcriptional MerR regulator